MVDAIAIGQTCGATLVNCVITALKIFWTDVATRSKKPANLIQVAEHVVRYEADMTKNHGVDGFHRDIVKQQLGDSYPLLNVDGTWTRATVSQADNSITADPLRFADLRRWLHMIRAAINLPDVSAQDTLDMAGTFAALEAELIAAAKATGANPAAILAA